MVERHSGRAFTFPKDKLISLDGLVTALRQWQGGVGEDLNRLEEGQEDLDILDNDSMVERWRRDFHGEYQFGIWSKTLPNCLFWIPVGIHADPHMAHVPTWSWASRAGRVSYGLTYRHFEVSESTAATIRFSSRPNSLTVLSRAKPVQHLTFRYCTNKDGGPLLIEKDNGRVYRVYEDLLGLPDRPNSPGIHLFYACASDSAELDAELGWLCFDDGNFEHRPPSSTTLFLLMGKSCSSSNARWSHFHMDEGKKDIHLGILIEPCRQGKYKRVGFGTLLSEEWMVDVETRKYYLV